MTAGPARDAPDIDLDPAVATFHAAGNQADWIQAAVQAIVAGLRDDLARRPRARLLLSGGSTPSPVYAALGRSTAIEWSRVDVALVDERWLQPDDPDSNARLVRETLLRGPAAAARFETLTRAGRGLEESVITANAHARHDAGVVVLGMGDDGHTASLFPGMVGLPAALASTSAYVAVDATGCPGAGKLPRRISLTPAGLAPSRTRLMLLRGDRKRALVAEVLDGTDPLEYPARVAFTTPGPPLHIFWCP